MQNIYNSTIMYIIHNIYFEHTMYENKNELTPLCSQIQKDNVTRGDSFHA